MRKNVVKWIIDLPIYTFHAELKKIKSILTAQKYVHSYYLKNFIIIFLPFSYGKMEANLIPRIQQATDLSNDNSINGTETEPLISNGGGLLEATNTSSEAVEVDNASPPRDKCYTVYMIFFLLGMSTLLPWNFFISLNNFWDYKFRDINNTKVENNTTSSDETELQKIFTSYLSIASTIPNATFVILNAWLGQRFNNEKRITVSLTLVILLFGAVTGKKFLVTLFLSLFSKDFH